MKDKDLKDILGKLDIPEPSSGAMDRAMRAASGEFEKNISTASKGSGEGVRPMGRETQKGGRTMKTPALDWNLAAGLAVALLVTLAIVAVWPGVEKTWAPRAIVPLEETPVPTGSPSGLEADTSTDRAQPTERAPVEQAPAAPAGKPSREAAPEAAPMPLMAAEEAYAPALDMVGPRESRGGLSKSMPMAAMTAQGMGTSPPYDPYMPPAQGYHGRDEFGKITPNPVKVALEEPVSTFSIDVDTASYAFVRRSLNQGYMPPGDAVRVEEMINYFDYDYPASPDPGRPFKPTVAIFPTPWNEGTLLMHIGIKGHEPARAERPRANLVFLLDVSGSMQSPDKLPLLKSSMRMLVENLAPEDTVAIVVYAGAAGAVLEPTRVGEAPKILAALDGLEAGGSTAGGEGIRQAYALAARNLDSKGVNRVILATDGDFNVGITSTEDLKGFVEREREKGISLSVLGFGMGNYRDELMQALAQNGNGNAAYIDSLSEARKVLVDEAASTLFTIAGDVKVQVEFNPARVREYRLIGYESRLLQREDFNNDRVDAGDVGAGHSVTAIYEIVPVGSGAALVGGLRYGSGAAAPAGDASSGEYAYLKMRYKLPGSSRSELLTLPITDAMAYEEIGAAPEDMRFAASVAAFGQILRGGKYTGDYGYDDVVRLALGARGSDEFGYRAEFMNLVRLAKTASSMQTR